MIIFFISSANASNLKNTSLNSQQIKFISPVSKINHNSAPSIIFECVEGYTKGKFHLRDDKENSVYKTDLFKVSTNNNYPYPDNNYCYLFGNNSRAAEPPVRSETVGKRRGSISQRRGLKLDTLYNLTLTLKGDGLPPIIGDTEFSIVENLYSDFSSDAKGWTIIRGPWKVFHGKYNITGNSRGKSWLTIYPENLVLGRKKEEWPPGNYWMGIPAGKLNYIFETRINLNCSGAECLGGIALYGKYHAPERWFEIVVSGDKYLSVRIQSTGYSPVVFTHRLHVKDKIGNNQDFWLKAKVTYDNEVLIYINNQFVKSVRGESFWPKLNEVTYMGHNSYPSLVFISYESTDSMSVNEVNIRPSRDLHTKYTKDGRIWNDD